MRPDVPQMGSDLGRIGPDLPQIRVDGAQIGPDLSQMRRDLSRIRGDLGFRQLAERHRQSAERLRLGLAPG
ncbi:MAG: hypothetical protein D8M53_09615 [Armatimonadetes bacterium]|nr:hypothetical protein [Armatimonadota bacterium]